MTDQVKKTIDKKLNQPPVLTYPLELGSVGMPHITQFNVYKYIKNTLYQFELKEQKATIRLPTPQKLSNADMLEYEEFSASMLGNLVAGITKGEIIQAAGVLAAGVTNNILGADGKYVQAQVGVSINPRIAHVFKTPRPREMQFEYSFVARNERESVEINKIIRTLRYLSYPSANLTSTSLFDAPEIFVIRHLSLIDGQYLENDYLPKPLPAALVGINVDENPIGEASFFKDSFAPVERRVTLMFKEMEIDTKQTLLQRYPLENA